MSAESCCLPLHIKGTPGLSSLSSSSNRLAWHTPKLTQVSSCTHTGGQRGNGTEVATLGQALILTKRRGKNGFKTARVVIMDKSDFIRSSNKAAKVRAAFIHPSHPHLDLQSCVTSLHAKVIKQKHFLLKVHIH